MSKPSPAGAPEGERWERAEGRSAERSGAWLAPAVRLSLGSSGCLLPEGEVSEPCPPPPPARPRPRTPPPPGGEQDEARGGARAAGARVCLVRAAPSAAGWASVGTGWRGKERLCRRDGEAALGKR